ncbi:MAG: type IV pilus assembly protein PilM [Armatimonadota bacterium]|nr:type IV pilus assembly protein PilM [Armatimonadota bacterium]
MLGLGRIFGKETVVGVDIGSRLIKVVQADPGRGPGEWRITRAAVGATPDESVRDGVIVNRSAVAAALRDLFGLAAIEATAATAAISGSSVIVRHVKMPRMAESVLRKSVRFEAGKYISASVDDSLIEFEITGPIPGEPDKMGVMLVAAPNDMVESRLQTLSEAGVEPVGIDVEAFALQRALLDLSATRPGDGATLALLDVGAVTTDVNIITNGQFALTRNISIAGDNFTTALKSASSRQEWAELEALKTQVDMGALLSPDANPEQIALARAVQPVMDELLREVRRSTNYYQSQLNDPANSILPPGVSDAGAVSKIIVTGGSAKMLGLEAYMAARLGVPVELWNVFDNPALDTSAFAPSFLQENHSLLTTGVGLALKELTEATLPRLARRSAPLQAAA